MTRSPWLDPMVGSGGRVRLKKRKDGSSMKEQREAEAAARRATLQKYLDGLTIERVAYERAGKDDRVELVDAEITRVKREMKKGDTTLEQDDPTEEEPVNEEPDNEEPEDATATPDKRTTTTRGGRQRRGR